MDGGPQHPHRLSLGATRRCEFETGTRQGTRRAAARTHSYAKHTHHDGADATNTRNPHRVAQAIDPVGSGFVASFPRPGGNVTGFISMEPTLASKWLELLKEVAPYVNRVAILFNPITATDAEYFLDPFKAAAAHFNVEAIMAPVRDTSEFASVIAAQARAPNGGLVVMPDTFMNSHRVEITSLAARYLLPAVYPYRIFAEAGGLLAYANDILDNYRRVATYADRILNGAKREIFRSRLRSSFIW